MKPTTTRIAALLGLRSDVDPERMSPGDLTDARNVRLDASGRASRRGGRSLISAGSTHGLHTDGETVLCVRGGKLRRVNADNSLDELADVAGLMAYCNANGLIYWSDGTTTGVVEANRSRSWGLAVPSLPAANTVTGSLPPGDYQYTVTLLRADGQESGCPEPGIVSLPNGGGLSLTMPVSSDADVIRAMLYLSTADGTTLYKAGIFPLGSTANYTGSGKDLIAPLLTRQLMPPPAGNALAWMAGRVWVGLLGAVFPSSAFSPELFDYREYLPVHGNVTMLAASSNQQGMFVGTDKGAYYLSGGDPKDMTLVQRGSVAVIPGCLAYVPGHKFLDGQFAGNEIPVWACADGLYAGLPDGSILSLTEQRFPLDLSGRGAAFFDRALDQYVFSAA